MHEWVGRSVHLKNFYCPKSLGTLWDEEICMLQSHKVSSKLDQKQKKIIARTFYVNKKYPLNLAQNFRKFLFNLAGSESGEKTKWFENFAYISQLFVYKTCL